MSNFSVAILGGDLRQCYLAKYIQKNSYPVTCFGIIKKEEFSELPTSSSLVQAVSGANLIICPTPFLGKDGFLHTLGEPSQNICLDKLLQVLKPGQILAGGSIPSDFIFSCNAKHVRILDFMKEENLTRENAALTAEGLLSSLIYHTPFSLKNRRILLLGYGHCGVEIAKKLSCFTKDIFIFDRDISCLAKATMQGFTPYAFNHSSPKLREFDLIINTIPSRVLSGEQLESLSSGCILFDIASAPFGFDLKVSDSLGLTVIRCPGIPGKMMPKTAGELIGKVILERISSYEF